MDGVLADFSGAYAELSKGVEWRGIPQGEWEMQVRKKYRELSSTPEWWATLPWCKGGSELSKVATHLFSRVCILSSASTSDPKRFPIVEEGKRLWIKKNVPQIKDSDVFIVAGKAFKKDYAAKNAILVDDVKETIQNWNSAGGFGILHHSSHYKETIETLEEITSPMNLGEIAKRLPIMRRSFWKME